MGNIDFTNLNGTTGEITTKDIQMGIRCNHQACALAIALERMFPGYTAFIDEQAVISDDKGNTITDMAISDKLLIWIDRFDNKKPVEPTKLRIDTHIESTVYHYILRAGDEPNEQ